MKNFLKSQASHFYTHRFDIEDISIKVVIDSTFKMNLQNKMNSLNQIPLNTYKDLHFHVSYEYFFISDGNLDLLTFNGDSNYTNSIIVIPPFYKHISINGKNYRFLVEYSKNKTNSNVPLYDVLIPLIDKENISQFPISPQITFYLSQLDSLLQKETYAKNIRITSILSLIFSELFNFYNLNLETKSISSHSKNYVPLIDTIINEQFSENLTLATLSKKLFLCEKQVSRIIKHEYGTSFSVLIKQKKLSIAAILLKQTNMSIQEISDTLSFNTENYFYSLFKKEYGCSPLKYRKQYK